MKFIQVDYSYSRDLEINCIPSVLVANKIKSDKNGNPRYEIKLLTALLDGSIVVFDGAKTVSTYNIKETLETIANDLEENGIDQTF